MLSITVGITETMTVVAAKLKQLVDYSCCVLFLRDEEQLVCRFVSGVNPESIENEPFLFEEQARTWLTNLEPSTVEINPRVNTQTDDTFQSTLVISLVFQNRLLGVLALYHKEHNAYTTEHQSEIESVSSQISAIVANSMFFNQTQYDSLSDPLTGLPNRRAFTRHLKDTLNSAKRTQSQLALFVIDLDQFKQINDHYGHLVGDQALCDFGHMLNSIVAPSHFCARYAGDEFILILSDCNNKTVQRIYGELTVGLETLTVETRLGTGIKLKASTGIALFPADGNTHEQLFVAADNRMYENKTRLSLRDEKYLLRTQDNIKSKASIQTRYLRTSHNATLPSPVDVRSTP
jgi:diguanylate cyclase (GGDEF)-like protein|tara:strand:+ start:946 stop:1989 length:1044 start_codon:yes stop_codon:yes gene_type:complete